VREYRRISTIRIRASKSNIRLEGNLWQFATSDQLDFLESIARAGCVRGEPEPATFDSWIRWKLGDRIAEEYMLPYNRKLWSLPLSDLGIDWLHKLPSVSFREVLLSVLQRKSQVRCPRTAVSSTRAPTAMARSGAASPNR